MKTMMRCGMIMMLIYSHGCSNSVNSQAGRALRRLAAEAKYNIKLEIDVLKKKEGLDIDLELFDYSLETNPISKAIEGRIRYSVLCIANITSHKLRRDHGFDYQTHLAYQKGVWIFVGCDKRSRTAPISKEYIEHNGRGIWGVGGGSNKAARPEDFTIIPEVTDIHSPLMNLKRKSNRVL